jgi:predicted RNA binding protein YcfA (HicA-like mRNA interferase family)
MSAVPTVPAGDIPDVMSGLDATRLPPGATFLRILGVNYVHIRTADEGDLYVTEHGMPFLEHLKPENWYEPSWFHAQRVRLEGTSTIYRVPTRPVNGRMCRSLDIVVKWSRVGEDVPLNTFTFNKAINAEFNTPFEEFSLVEELRTAAYGPSDLRIPMQKALAIYVPPERMQLWQTGRSKSKIMGKIARHPSIEIDILRSYILLYAWIDGINAVEAYRGLCADPHRQQAQLEQLAHKVNQELEHKGFTVADNKPSHFIVRTDPKGAIRMRRDGELLYALVDYELLARTPAHEDAVRASSRSRYLSMMARRFNPPGRVEFPPHLRPARVHGVDYIYGRTESTNGALWVIGRNPELFSYFLPERWRTKQVQLSRTNQTYYTQTKDRIHLVWKVSRVGDLPPGAGDERHKAMLAYGYNSPFEEAAFALDLQRRGVRTVYPRAIYMTGQDIDPCARAVDERRFQAARGIPSPEGLPALRMDRDYITIWGYWRGLEDEEAASDVGVWTPIDALQACAKGLITQEQYDEMIGRMAASLERAGYVDLAARGDHVLLSYIPEGTVKKDANGLIEIRQSNFEMVKRIA